MVSKIYQHQFKVNSTFFQTEGGKTGQPTLIDKPIFPLSIDNRQKLSPVDNQGNWPACVCFATCSIAEAYFWRRNGYPINFDAVQLYAHCKKVDGHPDTEGTQLFVGLECAVEDGLFGDGAVQNDIITIVSDGTEKTINQVKSAVFKYDFLLGGFIITDDYYYCNIRNYKITHEKGHPVGGHCMTICGWNQEGFIIQNQWGTKFGAKGFCILPYDLFLKEFSYASYLTNSLDNLS